MLSLESAATEIPTETSYCDLLRELSHFFAVEFSVWTGSTGDLLHASTTQPVGDQLALAGLVSAVEQRQEACFILDGDSVLSLAIPVVSGTDSNVVVTAWFVTREVDAGDTLADAPALLLMTSRDTLEWAREQEVWSPKALLTSAR